MGWQGIVVLLRLRVFAVWAAFPVVLVALIASEDLRLALMAWMGTMWIVFAWFWLARFKTVSWRLISGVFAIGMPWAGVIAWLSSGLADSARVPIDDAAAQVVIASIVEEVLKLAPLAVIALVAPGRARRFLISDWLVLGVGLGAGFEAVEEMIRRLTFLSGAMSGGLLDRLLCPSEGSAALECLGFPMFGLSPFSGAGGEAYAYCGHAILTGLVAGSIGLARHLWWRSAGHGPASIAVVRSLCALLPLGALWLAVVDHMGRNASGYEPWDLIGGEAPWGLVGFTADLAGNGSGQGRLLVCLLVVGAVLDARVLCLGGYSDRLVVDVDVCEGRLGGGVAGSARWEILRSLPTGAVGRGVADVVDTLVLPWLEWRMAWRAVAAGHALRAPRLMIATVMGLREERESAARAVLDPRAGRRWPTRIIAIGAALLAVLLLARVPGLTQDLARRTGSPLDDEWLAGLLEALGLWWESLSPVDQGLFMLLAGALVILSGGGLGLAFNVGMGLAMLGSARDAADFLRDPKGTIRHYLATHTPSEILADGAMWLAGELIGGGLGHIGGRLVRDAGEELMESGLWRKGMGYPVPARRPAYAGPDPRHHSRAHRARPKAHDGVAHRTGASKSGAASSPGFDPRGGKHIPGLRKVEVGDSAGGPGAWTDKGKNNGSARSQVYEEEMTGVPIENSYYVDGVEFDGYEDGVLIDAKGPGYAHLIGHDWNTVEDELIDTANRQARAAARTRTPIEWRIAEPELAAHLHKLQERGRFSPSIRIIQVPPTYMK